jgi:hypothetical protein
MKKSEAPSDSRLKSIEKESPDQFKVREGKKDNSIRSDKDPLPEKGETRQTREDLQNKTQDEFIDRDNNSKEEG